MLTALRIKTNQLPPKIQYLNDNSYYYNYDIKQESTTKDGEEEIIYSFIQVHVYGHPNYKDCVKAVIRAFISVEEEFDLINSLNKITIGLDHGSEDVEKYTEYIHLLDTIKTNIKNDFL